MYLAHLSTSSDSATRKPQPRNPVVVVSVPSAPASVTIPEPEYRIEPAEPVNILEMIPATAPAPRSEIVRVEPVRPERVAPFDEYPNGSRYESVTNLQPLRGTGRSGDFVHNTQTMDSDFRNVSRGWTARAENPDDSSVMTWEQAFEHVEREQGETRDIRNTFEHLTTVEQTPIVDDDGNVIEYGVAVVDRDGNRLRFTETSLDQFANWTNAGLTLPRRLATGDEQDRSTLVSVFNNGLRKLADKPNLLRLRSDGTLRAVLSEKYCILDNRWFLEVLRRLIPDGLVSHFRSPDNCDSVFFNILIPDSMRAETDSEYGGMLACGNGETGERKLGTCPSIFRAICMNGCIWDEVTGTGIISKVHRGEIDLGKLASLIRDNLNRQIPLLGTGIDAMLATRSISAELAPVPALGAVLRSLAIPGITKIASDNIVNAYLEQRTEPARVLAFDVLQGLTKAAQGFSPGLQETTERAAGAAMLWTGDRWHNVFTSAKTITSAELERVFGKTVVS